ncbi:MAG: PH domain-containing protein [Synergistetes bacterium]|nr:PH domain-containing protein [Synergistota bacterium]
MISARPSWWNFFWHILVCWILIPIGIMYLKYKGFFTHVNYMYWKVSLYLMLGCIIVTLLVILWEKLSLKFIVYDDRVVLRRGVLSKDIKEIFIRDIRTIDIKQNLIQRIINIGDIMIASSGTSEYEMHAKGLPAPDKIREKILEFREKMNNEN